MKSIIEREQFRHEGQSNTKTIITSICKGLYIYNWVSIVFEYQIYIGNKL